jgi:hypothetical protein
MGEAGPGNGYLAGMTSTRDSAQLEAIQGVVDRVTSYQDGATEGTVEHELRKALGETDIDLTDDDVAKLASAIEDEHGAVDAAAVLG